MPKLYLKQKLNQIFLSAPTELKVGYKGLVLTEKEDIKSIIEDVEKQYYRNLWVEPFLYFYIAFTTFS